MLLIAFAARQMHAPMYCFLILSGAAILFKTFFLIGIIRNKSIKVGLWFYLILTGIAMVLISLLFKNIFPIPIIRNILFFGAILMKITGLILVLTEKKKIHKIKLNNKMQE